MALGFFIRRIQDGIFDDDLGHPVFLKAQQESEKALRRSARAVECDSLTTPRLVATLGPGLELNRAAR